MRTLSGLSRFAAQVEASRAQASAARALLVEGRKYTRDREGKFSSTGGGGAVADLPRGPVRSIADAAKGTNPNYGSTLEGPTYRDAARAGERWTPEMGPPPSGAYEANCTNAVMAFEMRMRGYNVQAAPLNVLDKYGYAAGRTNKEMDDQFASNWKSADGTPHGRTFRDQKWRSLKEIDAEVGRWPEGGRGFVNAGKHVFAVVKKNGKAQYVESQFDASPTAVVTRQYRKKYGGGKVIRLDDLVPTDEIFESIAVPE